MGNKDNHREDTEKEWDKDSRKHKYRSHNDDDDDDGNHKHGSHHEHEHQQKPPQEPSCFVENVRSFGTASSEVLYPKTIKVPVTLAEPSVIICVEADVHLEKPAVEIKRTWKSVILEQCELVPTFNPKMAKLFVSGLIRKTIEYATVDHYSATAVCGDIRHTTALIPFDFCTDLTFPTGGPSLQLAPDFTSSGQLLDHSGHGPLLTAALHGNRQVYNERPYCQLLFSEFTELDLGQNVRSVNGFEHSFTVVREKIVLRLGLKVLQDQQLPIPTPPPPPHKPPYSCK